MIAKQLTAVYERHGDYFVAYLQEIPGVNTQGRTMQEARENLEDALQIFLDANSDLGLPPLAGGELLHTTHPMKVKL